MEEVKGSVSWILRWVLIYINGNLSLRPIIASNKILSLLKGHFTINKKVMLMRTLVQWYCFIQTILKTEVNVGMRNIEMRNSSSEWVECFIQRKCLPHFWSARPQFQCYQSEIFTYNRPFSYVQSVEISDWFRKNSSAF